MTSEADVGHIIEQHFAFHCSCGAAIETRENRETCPDCGESVEVIRCVPTPNGTKYTLRISKHRHGWNAEPPLWPLGCTAATTLPTPHHHRESDQGSTFRSVAPHVRRESGVALPPLHWEPIDYNQRFTRLGLMILLAPLYLPLLLMLLSGLFGSGSRSQAQAGAGVIEMQKPQGCGWFSGCHYEQQAIRDNRNGKTIIIWRRVNDY